VNELRYIFQSFNLGTLWCFNFFDEDFTFDKKFYKELEIEIIKKLQNFSSEYSRFDKNSLVYLLNEQKYLKNPPKDLIKMLEFAKEIFDLSAENFDITLARNLEKIGYDKTFDNLDKKNKNLNFDGTKQKNSLVNFKKDFNTIKNLKNLSNSSPENSKLDSKNLNNNLKNTYFRSESLQKNQIKEIKINPPKNFEISQNKKFIKLNPNKKIDLGGIGKGYLVDKIVAFLQNRNIKNFSINAGGDIFNTNLRSFYLQSPEFKNVFVGEIQIQNSAITASNSLYRNWLKNGKKQSHLIQKSDFDNQIEGVYVQAKNCLLADCLSTALFISPPEVQLNLYQKLDFEFMLIFKDQTFFKSNNYMGKVYDF
jgi:thiamine biosynthesis lipoprotein ApbE